MTKHSSAAASRYLSLQFNRIMRLRSSYLSLSLSRLMLVSITLSARLSRFRYWNDLIEHPARLGRPAFGPRWSMLLQRIVLDLSQYSTDSSFSHDFQQKLE